MSLYDGVKSVLQCCKSVKEAEVLLNNGIKMPVVGLGTYRVRGREIIFSVIDSALKAGYRSIDTAAAYGNESEISDALKVLLPKYNLKREDLFITSKLAPRDQGKSRVRLAVEESLKNLNLTYIDLYLIHWPGVSSKTVEKVDNQILRRESWEGLVSLQKEGKLKTIGVSNYTVKHLKDLLSHSLVPPAVNQVEYHPFFRHPDELLEFCAKENILLQAYSSFGGTGEKGLLTDQTIVEIGNKLQVQPSQVLLRWALQNGFAIIPKTVSEERMQVNLQLDFTIPKEEMDVINNIPIRKKYAWDPETVF